MLIMHCVELCAPKQCVLLFFIEIPNILFGTGFRMPVQETEVALQPQNGPQVEVVGRKRRTPQCAVLRVRFHQNKTLFSKKFKDLYLPGGISAHYRCVQSLSNLGQGRLVSAGRFVEHEEVGGVEECLGQSQPHPPPAGQLGEKQGSVCTAFKSH